MNTKGLVLPLILFAFATWIVYLVGLAGVQSYCFPGPGLSENDAQDTNEVDAGQGATPELASDRSITGNTAALFDVFTFSANKLACGSIFRFHWFFVAFTFVTLLGLLICSVAKHPMGTAMHYTRPFWVGMLAISTLLMIMASEAFLTAVSTGFLNNWYQTAAAGAIMMVVALVFLMFAVGTHFDYDKGVGKEYGGHVNVVPAQHVGITTGAERV